jgi:hypothetical protein
MSFRAGAVLLISLFLSFCAKASQQMDAVGSSILDLTATAFGFIAITIFVIAYVILEEKLHLRKYKPVLLAAGIIWILIDVA